MGSSADKPWSMVVLVDRSAEALLTRLPSPDAARDRYRLTTAPAVRLVVHGPLSALWDHLLVAWIRFTPDPGDGPEGAAFAGRPTPLVEIDPARLAPAALDRPPVTLSGLLRRLLADARERLEDESSQAGPRPWRPPTPSIWPRQADDQRKS